MKEIDARDGLNEEVERGLFSETALFLYQNEQVALSHVLHDEVDVLMVFEIRIHSHNVHMLKFLMNLDLTPESFLHFWCLNHSLI